MEKLTETMQRVKDSAPLREWCKSNLQPIGKSFECPACHSGAGPNKSPAFSITPDGKRWKCFSCGRGGDVYDLAGIVHGTEDRAEQARLVAEWAGAEGPHERRRETKPKPPLFEEGAKPKRGGFGYEEGRARHRALIEEARRQISHPEAVAYLQSRGITEQDAREWGLGYDARRRRIVIPWAGSDFYHVDRDVTGSHPHKYEKPRAEDVGPQPMWNPGALGARSFFVVEGALDAMAVQACGKQAVALGGIGARSLIEAMGRAKGAGVAVLMLDNDEAGRDAQARIAEEMEAAGLPHREARTDQLQAKDAGEAWARDRAGLASTLDAWARDAEAEGERREEERYAQALRALRVLDPTDVAARLYTMENAHDPIPTGLACIDRALGGGLPGRGLVTLGAVSSVGKTTLAVQIADALAAAGRGVLFVTVEQSAEEIVAKSLSRIMGGHARSNGSRIQASAQAIMSARERAAWAAGDAEKAEALLAACNEYDAMTHGEGGRQTLRIMEAAQQPTVADIRAAAEQIARHDGEAPVVFIDYLQLLAAEEGREKDSDKQITDRNVMALRQAARDLGTCVFVISSLNRASYSGSVSLDSFKESGAIEYGSDVLLGLQPANMERDLEGKSDQEARREARKAMRDFKADSRRACELVVLKNRNGGLPRYGAALTYDAICNRFTEPEK